MLQHFVITKVAESSGSQFSLQFPAGHTLSALRILDSGYAGVKD